VSLESSFWDQVFVCFDYVNEMISITVSKKKKKKLYKP
jgi:hypothetical protein